MQRPRLPRSIWALGFVSLFMDISSEMIHSLLPVFLVTVLGSTASTVGLIEGIGEGTASIAKLFSGWLSDRLGKRKALVLMGYGLGALSKPLFALAPSIGWVLTARFSDRIGKGIRGAPRDALVGDLVPPTLRGAAYGLRQSLDTVGAFAGPLLAIALMAWSGENFRLVFWLAVIPAVLSVAVLSFAVDEPESAQVTGEVRPPIRWNELAQLNVSFWGFVGVTVVLTLARFSEAFLILRAQNVGLPLAAAPSVLVVMNIVYAASAYPIGLLSDRMDRPVLLALGFSLLIVSNLVLAMASTIAGVMVGVGLWGLHMGMTQGLIAALIADNVPSHLRGSAFGVFHLVSGMSLLLASVLAGILWQQFGPGSTFLSGAVLTLIGIVAALVLLRGSNESKREPQRG